MRQTFVNLLQELLLETEHMSWVWWTVLVIEVICVSALVWIVVTGLQL